MNLNELCFVCELNTYRYPHSINLDDKLREVKKLRKEMEK